MDLQISEMNRSKILRTSFMDDPFYSLFPCIQNFMAHMHMHQSSAGFWDDELLNNFVVMDDPYLP